VEGKKGRPMKKRLNVIECDMRTAGVCGRMMREIG